MRYLISGIIFILLPALLFRGILYLGGFRVSSWFRSPLRNYQVGGAILSQHQMGWAFDVVPGGSVNLARIKKIPFAYVIDEGDHIHAQLVKWF